MSGWTEFVIADRNEADAIANEGNPKSRRTGFEFYKFFETGRLAVLYQLLGESSATWQDFPLLAFGECAWVDLVPDRMVELLRGLTDNACRDLAQAWLRHPEGIDRPYPPAEVKLLLQELRDLAREATKKGLSVLFWRSTSC